MLAIRNWQRHQLGLSYLLITNRFTRFTITNEHE
jgi:hypothetical protein